MKIQFVSMLGAMCVTCGATLLTASCSLLTNGRNAQSPLPGTAQHPPLQRRIAQLNFGRDAAYGVCIVPACPTVTPKTIASAGLVPVATAARLTTTSDPAPRPSVAAASSLPAADEAPRRERLLLQFSSSATALDAGARHELDKIIPTARKAKKITIIGRTDNVGSAKANDAIALARALHVRDYLRSRMKDVNNVIAIDAKGACCFLSNNNTPDGRQANRRVEVVFTYQG